MNEKNRLACEYLQSIGGKPKHVSWKEIADKFGISSENGVRSCWSRYKLSLNIDSKTVPNDYKARGILNAFDSEGQLMDIDNYAKFYGSKVHQYA